MGYYMGFNQCINVYIYIYIYGMNYGLYMEYKPRILSGMCIQVLIYRMG